MNKPEDLPLTAPASIEPQYRHQDGKFVFKVPLGNQSSRPVYFSIASTLGCCLAQTTKVTKIGSEGTIELSCEVKPTNLVGGGIQTLAIFASRDPILEKIPLENSMRIDIRLRFNEDMQMDPAILQILEGEIDNCLLLAEDSRSKGDLDQALNKGEQAYEINRFSMKAFEAMTRYRFELKDYAGAIRDITSILLVHPFNPHLKLKKTQLIMEWQKERVSQNEELCHYIKTSIDYFKDKKVMLDKGQLKTLQDLVASFSELTKKRKGRKGDRILEYLSGKALEKYSQDLPISKYFESRESLEQQLRDLFLNQKADNLATPEQALDPINYQIMKRPHILPSGSSYEQESLKIYFMTNGYKDPISRQQIAPNLIFPNHNLESYLRSHPQLKKWELYEYDLINN